MIPICSAVKNPVSLLPRPSKIASSFDLGVFLANVNAHYFYELLPSNELWEVTDVSDNLVTWVYLQSF